MKRLNFVLCLVCTLLISSAAHAAALRTVALSGQQAPGMPDGTVFGGFDGRPVVLNDAGQTAFLAGVWSEGGGSLDLVAASGQQAPGLPDGETYSAFRFGGGQGRIVINEAGITAFIASTTSQNPNYGGFWTIGPGNSQLLAFTGQQAAGLPDGVYYSIRTEHRALLLNDAGQTAFFTELTGSGVVTGSNDQAFWAQRNGNVELVARTGNHAPGTPDGVNFSFFSLGTRALNNNGQTAFTASLTGGGGGIWSEGSGSLALVARTGDQAPGMPDGVVFSGLPVGSSANPAFNNSGRTAFAGRVIGPGIDSTNNSGIWSDVTGSLALVVRSGTPAPGRPEGVKFSSFHISSNGPALNDAGQLAFFATATGGSRGLWSGAPDSLALVARTGDHAPGTEDGVVFAIFTNSIIAGGSSTPTLNLNAAGQTAFYAQLTGSGIDASNNLGIWATDRSGALQLIARTGDILEVAPGDFRTVAGGFVSLRFNASQYDHSTGNADGRPSAFNNLGQLAFSASFTDGTSGIFVSNRVAVPEPSTFALIAACLLGLVGYAPRRQRHRSDQQNLITTTARKSTTIENGILRVLSAFVVQNSVRQIPAHVAWSGGTPRSCLTRPGEYS